MWRPGLPGSDVTGPDFMVEQHSRPSAAARAAGLDDGAVPLYVVYPPNRHLSTKLADFRRLGRGAFRRQLCAAGLTLSVDRPLITLP